MVRWELRRKATALCVRVSYSVLLLLRRHLLRYTSCARQILLRESRRRRVERQIGVRRAGSGRRTGGSHWERDVPLSFDRLLQVLVRANREADCDGLEDQRKNAEGEDDPSVNLEG